MRTNSLLPVLATLCLTSATAFAAREGAGTPKPMTYARVVAAVDRHLARDARQGTTVSSTLEGGWLLQAKVRTEGSRGVGRTKFVSTAGLARSDENALHDNLPHLVSPVGKAALVRGYGTRETQVLGRANGCLIGVCDSHQGPVIQLDAGRNRSVTVRGGRVVDATDGAHNERVPYGHPDFPDAKVTVSVPHPMSQATAHALLRDALRAAPELAVSPGVRGWVKQELTSALEPSHAP